MVHGLNLKRKTCLVLEAELQGGCVLSSAILYVWVFLQFGKLNFIQKNLSSQALQLRTVRPIRLRVNVVFFFPSSLSSSLWEVTEHQGFDATAQLVGNSLHALEWYPRGESEINCPVLRLNPPPRPLYRQAFVTGPASYSLMMADHSWILVTAWLRWKLFSPPLPLFHTSLSTPTPKTHTPQDAFRILYYFKQYSWMLPCFPF